MAHSGTGARHGRAPDSVDDEWARIGLAEVPDAAVSGQCLGPHIRILMRGDIDDRLGTPCSMSRCCSSIPDIPPSRTSRSRHRKWSRIASTRKSSAEANPIG